MKEYVVGLDKNLHDLSQQVRPHSQIRYSGTNSLLWGEETWLSDGESAPSGWVLTGVSLAEGDDPFPQDPFKKGVFQHKHNGKSLSGSSVLDSETFKFIGVSLPFSYKSDKNKP